MSTDDGNRVRAVSYPSATARVFLNGVPLRTVSRIEYDMGAGAQAFFDDEGETLTHAAAAQLREAWRLLQTDTGGAEYALDRFVQRGPKRRDLAAKRERNEEASEMNRNCRFDADGNIEYYVTDDPYDDDDCYGRNLGGIGGSRLTRDASGRPNGIKYEPPRERRAPLPPAFRDMQLFDTIDDENARREQEGRTPLVVIGVDVAAVVALMDACDRRDRRRKRRERNSRRRAARIRRHGR